MLIVNWMTIWSRSRHYRPLLREGGLFTFLEQLSSCASSQSLHDLSADITAHNFGMVLDNLGIRTGFRVKLGHHFIGVLGCMSVTEARPFGQHSGRQEEKIPFELVFYN